MIAILFPWLATIVAYILTVCGRALTAGFWAIVVFACSLLYGIWRLRRSRRPAVFDKWQIWLEPAKGWQSTLCAAGVIFCAAACSFMQMKLSMGILDQTWASGWFIVKTLGSLFFFYLLTWLLFGRPWISVTVWSVLFTLLAFVNRCTLLLRDSPMTPMDILSAGTALNVLKSYTLPRDTRLLTIAALGIAQPMLAFAAGGLRLPRGWRAWLVRSGVCLISLALFCWCYLGNLEQLLRIKKHNEWMWRTRYNREGYFAVTLDKAFSMLPQPAPPGYDEKALLRDAAARRAAAADTAEDTLAARDRPPHILLIVNETWFDWRRCTDFFTDKEVMPFWDSLDNCLRGYAVNPVGNTSVSEYEILTSTTMKLTPGVLPFTMLNMTGDYSLVRHLKLLSYHATSFHPAPKINYNRSAAYPALGFDDIHFEPDYMEPEYVRNYISDQSCFEFLYDTLQQNAAEGPQFLYCLTIQNHGGYGQTTLNGGEMVLDEDMVIHLTDGFAGNEGAVEEYLSLLHYTDDAFRQLIERLRTFEEPVIVCMVGDHSSAFEVENSYTEQEANQRKMATPFVIWANYPLTGQNVGTIGMVQLAPLLLRTAGLPLSPFYDVIAGLDDTVLGWQYYQKDGTFYEYGEDIDPDVLQYLCYAYNNVPGHLHNAEELFWPYGVEEDAG